MCKLSSAPERHPATSRRLSFWVPQTSLSFRRPLTDLMSTKTQVVQQSGFNFLRQAQIWYDIVPRVLSEGFANVIVLSDGFYQEITAQDVPMLRSERRPAAIPIFGEWSGGRER
jgi:hypothetical protein